MSTPKINFSPDPSKPYIPPASAFKRRRLQDQDAIPLATQTKDGLLLTQEVFGRPASKPEELYFLAADDEDEIIRIRFQVSFVAGRNVPGEIRLDFILYTGKAFYPVFIDGLYWHRTAQKRTEDIEDAARIDRILHGTGAKPVQRIPDSEVEDLESARVAVERTLALYYWTKKI